MRTSRLIRALALTLLAIALLEAGLLRGEVVIGRDLLQYTYPRLDAIGTALADGHVPRWNPYTYHGTSWFGPRGGGVVYPGFVLFALLELKLAMALFMALHYAIALEGMRRWVRRDATGVAAAAAGVAYALGGFLVSMYWGVPSFLVSAAWLPWAALGGATLPERPLRGGGIVGAAVALCLLAGEPQGAMTAAVLATVLAVSSAGRDPRKVGRAALFACLAVGVAAAASGLTVLSIVDELPRTDRSLASFSDTRWGFAGRALLLDLLSPGVLGDQVADQHGYWGGRLWSDDLPWCGLGIGSLGLALAAAASEGATRRRRAALEGGLLVAAGVLVAALDLGALIGLRFSAKSLVLTALGLGRCVGVGFDAVWVRTEPGAVRIARSVLGFLVVTPLLVSLALLVLGSTALEWFAAQSAQGTEVDAALARWAVWGALLRTAGAAGLGLWLLQTRGRRRLVAALALGLLAGELLLANKGVVRTTSTDILGKPPLVEALQHLKGPPRDAPARLYSFPGELPGRPKVQGELTLFDARDSYTVQALRPNIGARYQVRSVQAFQSVRPLALERVTGDPRFAGLPVPIRGALVDAELFLMQQQELKAIPAGERGRLIKPLAELEGYTPRTALLRNLACPEWAYCAPAGRAAATFEDGLDELYDVRRRPYDVVILGPEGVEGELPATASHPWRVDVRAFEPERVSLAVNADGPTWLVVREAYSPDWRCELDGASVPIVRADLLYRAVHVPAGTHTVDFVHDPWWWGPGVRLTFVGWALLLAGLAFGGRRPS